MKIRCPNCRRNGYLPDHLVPVANSLRCRKCQANFLMPEVALTGIEPRLKERDSWRVTTVETPVASRSRETPALLLADEFVDSFDDTDMPSRTRGPGDSQYELTIALKDEPSLSGDDWAEVSRSGLDPEMPSSNEIDAIRPTNGGLSHPGLLSDRFLMSWIRPLGYLSLGFVVMSLLVIGFLLMRSLEVGGSPLLPVRTHVLVLASLGMVAFLLFGLWLVLLSVVVVDQAQRSRNPGDPEAGSGWR